MERSLAEQRTLIEQLESEQRAAHGRVDLATVEVRFEREVVDAAAPLGRQVSAAAREGMSMGRAFVVGLLLAALRAGPVMLVLALMGWAAWRVFRRRP